MGACNYTLVRKYELYTVCMFFNFQPENFSVEARSLSKGRMCCIEPRYCVTLEEVDCIPRTEQSLLASETFIEQNVVVRILPFCSKETDSFRDERCRITDRHKSDQGHKVQLRF